MNRKYDYKALEREYVSGDMSLRDLAKAHGMAHSLVMTKSQKDGWSDKRVEYRSRSADSAVAFMADRAAMRAVRESEVRDNAIEAIDEGITKMRADMKATTRKLVGDKWEEVPVMRLRPQDIVMLIDRMNVLFGSPNLSVEDRDIGNGLEQMGPDALREFVEATRGIGPVGGGSASSPLPRSNKDREN